MKSKRHETILALVRDGNIETQEDLQSRLQNSGFPVTQATISRDIRELGLIKAQLPDGGYAYALPPMADARRDIFAAAVIQVVYALNNVVIKCRTGMANAAAAAFDSMDYPGVLGSIAGDDTIIVITATEIDAHRLTDTLSALLR